MSHRRLVQHVVLLCVVAAWALAGCGVNGAPATATAPIHAGGAMPTSAATPVPDPTRVAHVPSTPTRAPRATATATPAVAATSSRTPTPRPTDTPSPTPDPTLPPAAALRQGNSLDLSLGWRQDANGHLAAGMVGAGSAQRWFLASLGRTVYAIDGSGNIAWRQKTAGPVYTLAAMPGGGVAAGDDAGFVSVFDDDGQRLWRVGLGTRVTAVAVAPVGGGLLAGGWDEKVTWLDAGSAMVWQADAGGPVSALAILPAIADLIGVATAHGEVRAYDSHGQEVWRLDVGSPVAALASLPVASGHLLLAGVQDGRLVAIGAAGQVAWQVALGSGAPVWDVAELAPGSWSVFAGTAGGEPSLVHLSAEGAVRWRVTMPAAVTAVEVHDLDATGSTGADGMPEIAAGLATGEVIVCDAEGRQRGAVHAGLPVWGLAAAPDGSLLVRADVVSWQIRSQPGSAGNPWLRVPSLAAPGLERVKADTMTAPDEVTLLFLGDVAPGRSMELQLLRNGPGHPWRGLAPLLAAEDSAGDGALLVVNLESVLTTRGEALAKPYVIRAHPMWSEMLAAGGVDLVSLANNHALDYGQQGLDDTLAALDALGIDTVGAGPGARRPAELTANGVRIAVLAYAAARWHGSEDVPHTDRIAWARPAQIATDVRAARQEADVVVVLLHAGTEYAATPSEDQVAAAHAAIEAGAGLVVGHHPHVTQTVEHYKDGLIVYSLGDAVFDIPRQAAMRGHLLRVVVGREGVRSAELWPFWIDQAIQPRLIEDSTGDGVQVQRIYP